MFIKVNLNPKNKIVGDCVIRAISFIAKQPWDKTYTEICNKGFEIKDMPSANNVWGSYLRDIGYKRYIIPNTCPDRYTVRYFCIEHEHGPPVPAFIVQNSNSDMERDIIERLMVKLG